MRRRQSNVYCVMRIKQLNLPRYDDVDRQTQLLYPTTADVTMSVDVIKQEARAIRYMAQYALECIIAFSVKYSILSYSSSKSVCRCDWGICSYHPLNQFLQPFRNEQRLHTAINKGCRFG
jgi:hypothetical protein